MLTSTMTPIRDSYLGKGAVVGWTMEFEGQFQAFVPGEDCAPVFVGVFDRRCDAENEVSVQNELIATRSDIRETVQNTMKDELAREISKMAAKLAKLRKQLNGCDHWDRHAIRLSIIRLEEEINLKGVMLYAIQ